ncbi:MAG: hypothetical protein HOB17_12565 [Candidatus Marinimicrobia bacterium]|nr:hypothetical protein [Candidatus Neomarinimicrobiota bacterium]MBT7021074.1 hypothetical protein [Candidatus Neomarinimicrobiota bacterium]
MENLWTENNTISYYYEWDRIPDVDQDEMFEFLVDEMDVYDLNLLLSDEFITQITLKNQKMKG